MALASSTDWEQPEQEPEAKDGNEAHQRKLLAWIKSENIAKDLDDRLLQQIGERVIEDLDVDETSRADWKTKTETAMELAMQIAKEKQFPWPKAANVIYPLLTSAAMQFAARAYPAIVQNRNVVRGVVIGADDGVPTIDPRTGQPAIQQGPNGQPMPVWQVPPGAKQSRADRIGDHMSWQLLDEMSEWEPETDTLLHVLPIIGCDFRKSYFDPGRGRNCSLRVSAMDLVINYKAKSMETAARISELLRYYPREIEEMFNAELWIRPGLEFGQANTGKEGEASSPGDEDAPHTFVEQHRYWDLDDDGYTEPYIVTVHKESRQVVRIVARYDAESIMFSAATHKLVRIDPIHYYTKFDFLPNPDGGIYGVGFGQLLRPINEAVNTTLNQLIDAGTLQNAGGGFIGKGMSMNAGAIRFQLGEYKVVNTPGATIRDNLVPLDFKGPSPVLFELLGMLIDSGKEVAAIKDILTGEQTPNQNTPATTTLAIIEQGLKVFSAIYKRVYRALKSELAKLYRLNRIYGKDNDEYRVGSEWRTIAKQDYIVGGGVEPIADPTMVTDMQALGRAQFLLQFAQDPWCNGGEIRRRAMAAANIDNIDKIVLPQPPPNPMIAAKGMELEIKGLEQQARADLLRAQKIQSLATAINQLAQADKAVGDQHIAWLDQQLRVWEAQFSAMTEPMGEGQSPGGEGPPPPPLPHPLHPSMQPGQQAPDENAPLQGARKAPDGNWYTPDPSRQGKYLQVTRNA